MPIQPLATYTSDLATGVPQFGDILNQAIKNYYQNQLTKAQAGQAEQKALQDALLNKYLSGDQGGDDSEGSADNTGGGFRGNRNELAQALINKKLFGSPELPSQQSAREYEDFQRKEKFKKEQEQQEGTTASITQQQTSRSSAAQAIKPIENLLSRESTGIFGQYLGGSDEKFLDTNALLAADNYMKAKNINPTVENLAKFHKLFRRGAFESEEAYKARLNEYLDEIKNLSGVKPKRQKLDNEAQIQSDMNQILGGQDLSHLSDAELEKIAGGS